MAHSVTIAKSFELIPGRYPSEDSYSIYCCVAKRAISEWGLRPQDVDGLFVPPSGLAVNTEIDVFTHERLAEDLGIYPRVSESVQAGGATYGVMIARAAACIRDGQAESILCVGAGKFPKVGAGGAEAMAKMVCHPEFEFPYGAYVPAIYALAASQYMAEYSATHADLAAVAVSARQWALRNPRAVTYSRGAITVDDVLASRPIATPFHLLDCSFPCEGGGAVLVTTAEMARALGAPRAELLGLGERHTHNAISQARSLLRSGAIDSAESAFARAGLGRDDIDMAQIYDAFSINPLLLLEDTGFCDRGEAAAFVRSGAIAPGGALPLNTNGGLLSFGHVGDGSGLSVIIEAVRQVTGTAGANQLDGIETAFVHTYGGMMAEHVSFILGRSE